MKIGILVPDEEMGLLAAEMGKNMGVDVFWRVLDDDEIGCAQELIWEHNVDALIARNPVSYLLEKAFDIPVATMHISRMDVLRAMQHITPGKTVAFLYVPEDKNKYNYNVDEFYQYSGHTLRLFGTSSGEVGGELVEAYTETTMLGIPVAEFIACGALVSGNPKLIRFAQSQGMETSLIHFDSFDIQCALSNAVGMVKSKDWEIRNTRLAELALNATEQGFLTLENGRVTMVSDMLCRLAGLKREEILGHEEEELLYSSSILPQILRAQRKQIITINDSAYSVFRRAVSNPHDNQRIVLISVIDVSLIQKTEGNIRKALSSKGFLAKYKFGDMIMKSEKMFSLVKVAQQYAVSDKNILILGESGTGKEVMAQSIHNASPFVQGPFVALNCAALPENLIESELFGYEEGAFTGARKGGKPGMFELSHGGTLFLDEIGELPMPLQAKLLRSIQERCISRVGGDHLIPIRNRLICATNQNLEELVKQKKFREDLFYRISVLQIDLPPLRERKEDIPLFVEQYCKNFHLDHEKVAALGLALTRHDWPGNVRELENVLDRLFVLSQGGTHMHELERYVEHAYPAVSASAPASHPEPADEDSLTLRIGTMEEMEQQILLAMRERCGGNNQMLSRRLDLGYSTIQRKLKKLQENES